MTLDEARELLGVEPGDGPEEVRARARLMKQRTPRERGGSAQLFRLVHRADEVLEAHGDG